MSLHFVYAFSPHDQQLQSPFSITRNLYNYLSQRTDLVYHMWDECKLLNLGPNDVLLGHPHYEHNTVMQQVFRRNVRCKARCLIHPFHHRRVEDNFPFDFMAREADKIFSICGPYWYDTIESTPFAHWKPKMVRLDMAVDTSHFPFLRQETGPLAFNPPGHRKLVYIGSTMPQKNLGYMVELMSRMPDVKLHWYGGSGDHPLARLPNVSVVGWVTLDRNIATHIVENYDIMINTSISDANPTTLLETRAWGLITACTKESGYYKDPYFTELYLDDISGTIDNIRQLLLAPSHILYGRAIASRAEIESRYSWSRFCETVWSNLAALC